MLKGFGALFLPSLRSMLTTSVADRIIMSIEGNGMDLAISKEGSESVASVELRDLFTPFEFSGDWTVSNTLVDGPIRDFNIIVRRSWGAARCKVVHLGAGEQTVEGLDTTKYDALALVCLRGAINVTSLWQQSEEAAEERQSAKTNFLAPRDCVVVEKDNAQSSVALMLQVDALADDSDFVVVYIAPHRS